MDKSENKQSQDEKKPRCDPEQLEWLLECSRQKDISDWEMWRDGNPDEEIWLEEAKLSTAHLEGVNLHKAHLKGANLSNVHLKNAYLSCAHLQGANLYSGHLGRVYLEHAHLEGASLHHADLGGARLNEAHLEGAELWGADLAGATLQGAHLQGAELRHAHLEGADFRASVVDGSTAFVLCSADRKTDFRAVGLENCRIDEATKYLLQYNKRRMNWEDWYQGQSRKKWVRKMRQLLTSPVHLFWCMSDYGRSTVRILAVFLALAIVFAVAYWAKPDCVIVHGQVGGLVDFLHALYFSVVTMTTLGFGDIAANPASPCGQVLLMLQVFCGYFLLGAIVTRLSILFTAGGPAGRFSKKKNEQIEQ
jgi:hypothetical protein